jgi:NitT/TauT family transport system ATP-binding protein
MTQRELVLDIRGVSHRLGHGRILHDVNLKVLRGSIVALVGPSGCGKSTLLRAIVGTHPPEEGEILVFSGNHGRHGIVARQPGRDRGIVYQKYTLFPFLTALQNVAFGLMLDETSPLFRCFRPLKWRRLRKRYMTQAMAFLDKVGLADAANLFPSEMSGGMQQRVAIAQALVMHPEILLFDEPFGALDEATREDLQRMLLMLDVENRQALAKGEKPPYTMIIVTHELNEAIYIGERVIGLSQHWDWRSEGITEPPGSTIVYDQCAPVCSPDDDRDFESFAKQRKQIRETVFDPNGRQPRDRHCIYWDQIGETEIGHDVAGH